MSSSAFYVGAAAHDSTDRIIYNSDTGALSYDPDGTGLGGRSPVRGALDQAGAHLSGLPDHLIRHAVVARSVTVSPSFSDAQLRIESVSA